MKTKILILFLFALTLNLFGQQYITQLTYNTALPFENLKDFTDKYSWRGFALEGKRFVQKDLSLGISFGWNIWDEKTDKIIELENGHASGTQIRYVNSFPILVNAHYYVGPRRGIRGFFGLNVGTYAISQRFDMGVYTINNNNWHFGLAPEVGFMMPLDEVSLTLNVKYNYAFSAGTSLSGADDNSYSYLGINIGLAFAY